MINLTSYGLENVSTKHNLILYSLLILLSKNPNIIELITVFVELL